MKTWRNDLPIYALATALLIAVWIGWPHVANTAPFDPTHADYDVLLERFVADGRVNYKSLKDDTMLLNRYLDSIAGVTETQFSAWSEPERLACLINLYNAATLKLILDHYPIDSIKDIGSLFKGPWDQPVVRLFGGIITLDDLEHTIIRKQFTEARIHMALVCAAKGCPPLRNEAYVAAKLDSQLDDQSRVFLTGPTGLNINQRSQVVYFSSIFKWYGEDFIGGFAPSMGFSGLDKTERAVANFCSAYLPAADSQFLRKGGYQVKYLDYDWSLNE